MQAKTKVTLTAALVAALGVAAAVHVATVQSPCEAAAAHVHCTEDPPFGRSDSPCANVVDAQVDVTAWDSCTLTGSINGAPVTLYGGIDGAPAPYPDMVGQRVTVRYCQVCKQIFYIKVP